MEAEKWGNVSPVPVGCANRRQKVVSQKLQSIPINEWTALEQGLAILPKPCKPGLYFMQSANSGW